MHAMHLIALPALGDDGLRAIDAILERRAAQVKREAMIDQAVRRIIAHRLQDMRRPIAGDKVFLLAANYASAICYEFGRLDRASRIVPPDPPFMMTATQPGVAS